MITIAHTHADGTLVDGTSRGDGTAEILKACRFRWFPSLKTWGIAQSRDHLAKRWQIDSAAAQLRAAGHDVTVEIDDTPRDVTEVKAGRAERLDARADRLTAASERAKHEAESRFAAADAYAERFAGGQPILVGHHSERSARTAQKRMDGHMRAGTAAADKAERVSRAASVVGRADAYRELPAVIIRRIDKTEAELRQTQHRIDGTRPANDWRGAYYAPEAKPAEGAYLEQLQARKTFLEHQLEADRAALAEHEANGYVRLSRETVHKGDTVTCWAGTRVEVLRVSAKSVTVPSGYSWTHTIPYDKITSVQCPHEGTETKITNPRRTARPKAEPVVIERPAQREAPVIVDGRFEYFPTPAPVVAQMIAAAGLEPGMTVLEPSAGAGAIASKVRDAGATVHCVEFSATLAERLRAAGLGFEIADFLTVTPRPLYDRVLMNPPFGGQADIRHVTHALGFLKPGGVLVAIMSAGAEFRIDKTAEAFRKLVADRGGSIDRLPADAFEASGTSVRTVIVIIPA
jgi:predicted RNA methylase